MARAASSSLIARLTAASDISPSPHFSPLPRSTMSVFGDAYFGQTCAAGARLGAADSTQWMSQWPTLNASSSARSSTPAGIRVEHRFRRDAAGGDRKIGASNPLQAIHPVLHGTDLLRPRQGNGRIGQYTFQPSPPFTGGALTPSAKNSFAVPRRERRDKPSHPCSWPRPVATPVEGAPSVRQG